MAYAEESDIQARMTRHIISATSPVTSVQVQGITDQVSYEIDSVLASRGYAVPFTTPDWFVQRLKSLNADGATAIILKSLFPEATGPGESPAYAFYQDRYNTGLGLIRSGDEPATDEGRPSPSSYFTRNPDSEEVLGALAGDSIFKIGRQF